MFSANLNVVSQWFCRSVLYVLEMNVNPYNLGALAVFSEHCLCDKERVTEGRWFHHPTQDACFQQTWMWCRNDFAGACMCLKLMWTLTILEPWLFFQSIVFVIKNVSLKVTDFSILHRMHVFSKLECGVAVILPERVCAWNECEPFSNKGGKNDGMIKISFSPSFLPPWGNLLTPAFIR